MAYFLSQDHWHKCDQHSHQIIKRNDIVYKMENANKRHVLTYKSGVPNQIKERSLNLNLQNKTFYGQTQFTTSHTTPSILA